MSNLINPLTASLQYDCIGEDLSTTENSTPFSLTVHSGDNLELTLLITAAHREVNWKVNWKTQTVVLGISWAVPPTPSQRVRGSWIPWFVTSAKVTSHSQSKSSLKAYCQWSLLIKAPIALAATFAKPTLFLPWNYCWMYHQAFRGNRHCLDSSLLELTVKTYHF